VSDLTWVGWVATVLFAICYTPQLIKTYIRKEVDDLSLTMWVVQLLGYTCGLIYGFYLKQAPLVVGYSIGWLSSAAFLIMYALYRKK